MLKKFFLGFHKTVYYSMCIPHFISKFPFFIISILGVIAGPLNMAGFYNLQPPKGAVVIRRYNIS